MKIRELFEGILNFCGIVKDETIFVHHLLIKISLGVIILGNSSWVSAKYLRPLESGQENSERMFLVVGAIRQELGLPEIKPEEKTEKKEKAEEKVKERPAILEGLGKGEAKVKEALAKNREILRAKKGEKEQERQEEQLQGNKKNIYQKWRNQVNKNYQGWQSKVNETYALWKEERSKFLKRLPEIKENLIKVPKFTPNEERTFKQDQNRTKLGAKENFASVVNKNKNKNQNLGLNQNEGSHVIAGSMSMSVRDQGRRPTCSAFAGIRAIEILLAQAGKDWDLSEQYFYWASKPPCQSSPCSVKGSWVKEAYLRGQEIKKIDIPMEGDCPYKDQSEEGNETQTPLPAACFQGRVRVAAFRDLHTFDEVVAALEDNTPVVAGFSLSENFFDNRGLVLVADAKNGVNKNREHAQGHAILLVGFLTMPENLRSTEGERCLLTANSWGEGWGKGGYACLSENWVKQFRFPSPFVALTSVEINDGI